MIGNPNPSVALTGIGFNDNLPEGVVIATPNGISGGGCGGAVVAAASSSTVTLSGGTLAADLLCEITVNVVGEWGGVKSNSVTVSSSAGMGNTSDTSLTVLPPATADRVYWTNELTSEISFANLDGTGGGDLSTGGVALPNNPTGVALDPRAGRVYWANAGDDHISFAELDGSAAGDLNTTGATVVSPEGVAVDSAAGRIYWANGGDGKISFANLDGSGGGDLNTAGATATFPGGVAIDPAAGRIYWANPGAIAFANLDGSGGGDLNTAGATLNFPHGVAIDPADGRIYWANEGANTISFANLDGSGGGDLSTAGATVDAPEGVAVDAAAGRIYWANLSAPGISYANLNGSGGGGEITTPSAMGDEYPVLLQAAVGAGSPAIAGGATPGSLLACTQGTWAPDLLGSFLYRSPGSFAYQWSVGGIDIPGATSSFYVAPAPGSYTCRVTASNPAGSAAQTSTAHAVATSPVTSPPVTTTTGGQPPVISHARLTNTRFRVASQPTAITAVTATSVPRGSNIHFILSTAARLQIKLTRAAPGLRRGRRCVSPSPKLKPVRRRRCTRTLLIGTLSRATEAQGPDSLSFTGRLGDRALAPGAYEAVLVASNTVGSSKPVTLSFTLVR